MCGIVGLFLKDQALEPQLGALLAPMLGVMTDRGPDSAGFAVYGAETKGSFKLSLRGGDAGAIVDGLLTELGVKANARQHDTHIVLTAPRAKAGEIREWLALKHPEAALVGAGARIALFKEVGAPADVARRFGLSEMAGSHAIGHTRMATESAVTTAGAHPFSTGDDQCLVHNGSLSNHASVRRKLQHEGLAFATDNDSEVAAGYLTWRMREGASLAEALQQSLEDLDGFYTFVVGTRTGFAVLRDPISCKPAVMAETEAYVAFGSEYRALAALPGIGAAKLFEPEPARVYAWERA